MGMRFRRSVKVLPGVRINLGARGAVSLSMGGRGARMTFGQKGTRTTVGLPGTGLSYSEFIPHSRRAANRVRASGGTVFWLLVTLFVAIGFAVLA